jgi:hypothetical protein
MIRNIFMAAVCSVVFSGILAAQELFPSQPQKVKTCVVQPFYAVSAGDNFEVVLQEGPCSVKLSTDEALQPYIKVSVRDSILYIDYDEKAVPSDIKRVYRGVNAPTPILRADVWAPALSGIRGLENAVIKGNGTVFSDGMELYLSDKAAVRDLRLDADHAKVKMDKNSTAILEILSETQLELSLEDNSQIKLKYKARNLLMRETKNTTAFMEGESATATYSIDGSARCRDQHKGNVLVVEAGGNSEISLSGQVGDLTLKTERNANLDALEMKTTRVKADMTGRSTANVNVEEFLSVNLTGGSALYYKGIPAFQVGKIEKSTLMAYEEKEKEK